MGHEWGLGQLDGHAEGGFENKQIDLPPLKGGVLIVLQSIKDHGALSSDSTE